MIKRRCGAVFHGCVRDNSVTGRLAELNSSAQQVHRRRQPSRVHMS
jgi:hypothetical protein